MYLRYDSVFFFFFQFTADSENWECYCCDPDPLEELQKQCQTVFDCIRADDKKLSKSSQPPATTTTNNSSKSAAAPPARSSSKSQSELADDPASLLAKVFTSVDFSEDNIVSVTKNLMEATTTFRRILLGIQCAIDNGGGTVAEEEEASPLFSFSEDISVGQKKRRCAKFIKQGLHTFVTSVSQIVSKKKQSNEIRTSSCSKSSTFAKSVSSLAASKCNGDVKNADSLRNSGSEAAACSLSESEPSTSLKSKSAATSSLSLNSLSVSREKSSFSKSENSQKCSGKKAEEKESTVTVRVKKEENVEKKKGEEGETGKKLADREEKRDTKRQKKAEKSSAREEKVPQPVKAIHTRKKSTTKDDGGEEEEQEEDMEVDFVEDSLNKSEEEAMEQPGEKKTKQGVEKSANPTKKQASTERTSQESNLESIVKKEKTEENISSQPEVQLGNTENCGPVTVTNSCDDMSQQEENLFAKLELIQELAEEFCKESAADKKSEAEAEGGEHIDIESEDASLPEVSFGAVSIDSDDSASGNNKPGGTAASNKTSKSGNEKVNDFSDISDADSDIDKNSKSSKHFSGKVSVEEKKKSVEAGEDDGGSDSLKNKEKSASQKEETVKKEEHTSASDEGGSDGEDVSSSDLILSSVEDEERRAKRKRRLKKKSEFSLCLSSQSLRLCPSSQSLFLMNAMEQPHTRKISNAWSICSLYNDSFA